MREATFIVVGAGVMGSAVARELIQRKCGSVIVLEKEKKPAQHTSGRNSGVIHSGFNPKPGTLKAKFCIEGNKKLKEFCLSKNIAMLETGTLVVAQKENEFPVIEELLRRGKENGAPGICIIEKAELQKKEPNVEGLKALFSPSGGITSGKDVTNALVEEAQSLGAEFFFEQNVTQISPSTKRLTVTTSKETYKCEYLINCAGLYADEVAHLISVGMTYSIVPFRGEYFQIIPEKKDIINTMVYPVPNLQFPFLGVHWTKTITGDAIIGPNATLAMGKESYSFFDIHFKDAFNMVTQNKFWRMWKNPEFRKVAIDQAQVSLSKKRFVSEAKKLVPNVELSDFVTGKRGNRAQLINQEGKLVDDILIERGEKSIHVLNAVSPGFTCSIPFAAYVVDEALKK